MRDHALLDLERVDQVAPGGKVEVKDGLVFVDAVFFDLGGGAGGCGVFIFKNRN